MPSGSRGSVSTTSGAPHGHRCATPRTPRGSRPSCAATAARSAAEKDSGGPLTATGCPRRRPARCPTAPRTRAARPGSRGPRDGRRGLRRLRLAQHEVRGLARHHEEQPLAGLLLDVRRVLPALALGLQRGHPVPLVGDPRPQGRDLGALGEVLADRDEQRDGHGDQDEGEDRGAGGERGPARHRARPRADGGGAAHRARARASPSRGRPAPARIAGGPAARAGSAARRGGRHGDECA